MKPTFLIITPSFNQVQFIQQTIDSVLSQTKVQVEYWVMDGGSSDQTVTVLQKFEKKLNWKSETDKGQTDAINKGINEFQKQKNLLDTTTRPVFFAYINSDDYYLNPEVFYQVAEQFRSNPDKQWLVGDAVIVNQSGKVIQAWIRVYKKVIRNLFPSWILLVLNPYPQPATFIRWSAVQQVGLFNQSLKYTMDYEYWLRLRRQFGEPIIYNQPISAFRIHTFSKGGSQYQKQFVEEYQVAQRFTDNLILLFLHRMHNWIILTVYGLIK